MSEKELREALRAIVDPAMFDGNYVRSDWLPLWREAHDHARRLLDIPAEPEQADEVAGLRQDADRLFTAVEAAILNIQHNRFNAAIAGLRVVRDLTRARLAPARDDTSGGPS